MHQSKIKTTLSIKPLVKYLQQRQSQLDSTVARDYHFLLEEIQPQNDLKPQDVAYNSELLQSTIKILTYILKQDKARFWALTSPLSSEIYYKSDALLDILNTAPGDQYNLTKLTVSLPYSDLCYRYILENFYNYTLPSAPELVHEVKSDDSQCNTYFQITQDNRFVEVSTDIPLPDVDVSAIDVADPWCPELLELKKLLPLDRIHAEGFSILTFKLLEVNQLSD